MTKTEFVQAKQQTVLLHTTLDYSGPFDVISGSILHIKFFAAIGDSCYVYGAGIDSSKLNASWGKSHYFLSLKPDVDLRKLKEYTDNNV